MCVNADEKDYSVSVELYKHSPRNDSSGTEPPGVPTALSATAASQSRIDLQWTQSGNTAGYLIYRDGQQMATSATASYSDTGLLAATTYSYQVSAYDVSGSPSSLCSPVSATTFAAVGGQPMPGLEDEKQAYRSWGWSWAPDAEPDYPADPHYYVDDPDIHGDTEGDDLWTYLMMYLRTGEEGYLDRAEAWARYFKEDYRTCAGSNYENFCYDLDAFGACHMYGWGLVAWYEYTGDNEALEEAEKLAEVVERLWTPGSSFGCYLTDGCLQYGPRGAGRHLLLVTRVAEATQKQRWHELRELILNRVLSNHWDEQRGMFFLGQWSTDQSLGSGAYASGDRIQSPFQIGVLTEALAHVYRTTGNQEVRRRITKMAYFVDRYGLDPEYQYTASSFGIVDNKTYHSYSSKQPVSFWDPVYTTSLVNTLAYGCQYSGNLSLCDRAKYFFNRGTKGIYGEPTKRTAADDRVHHFVDTRFATSHGNFYLDYNKGELQYTYMVFGINSSVHPADTNRDGCISINELSDHISQWMRGQAALAGVMKAIGVWKNGC